MQQHTAETKQLWVLKYFGEIETKFENILACLSVAQKGSYHEKNEGRKSRDPLPLRQGM